METPMANDVLTQRSTATTAWFIASEFKKLTTKLDWIGKADEARALEEHLLRVAPKDFVLFEAQDTD